MSTRILFFFNNLNKNKFQIVQTPKMSFHFKIPLKISLIDVGSIIY